MPGLEPGIHVLLCGVKGVDGRDKPGHDKGGSIIQFRIVPEDAVLIKGDAAF